MNTDLKTCAEQTANRLASLDFSLLWPGFHPFRFALYDHASVYFDGETFARTDTFLGNTSINFRGEQIAIWELSEQLDPDVLSAKIVHEMFHAFQQECGEKRFANEFEAIQKYQTCPELLALRHEENELLSRLLSRHDACCFGRLLSLRRYRMEHFPFEYGYESRIEAIEGAAQFVELSALRMLDAQKYEQACARLQDRLSKLDALLPVRISCYDSGAAMLQICAQSHHSLQLSIGDTELIFYQGLIDAAKPLSMVPETTPEILAFYEADQAKLRQLVENARSHPESRLSATGTLVGFNVYSARRFEDYIYTEYFFAYQADQPTVLNGDFLFRLDEGGSITELYRLAGR